MLDTISRINRPASSSRVVLGVLWHTVHCAPEPLKFRITTDIAEKNDNTELMRNHQQPFKNGSDWGNYHGADFTSKCLVEFEQGAPVGFQFLAIFEV